MDKTTSLKRIEELRALLEHHRVLYHVHDSPTISDEVYDSLMKELASLEDLFPEVDSSLSPTKRIGGHVLPAFSKVRHEIDQWSFDNVFNYQELFDWETRNVSFLKKRGITETPTYVAELKIDGLKIILTYENGKLIRGATRGDGEVGEDITENVKTIKSIPLVLPENVSITVIGEAWIKKQDLDTINALREKEGLPLYANTRNLAAGTLRQLDSKIVASRNLQLFAYDIETVSSAKNFLFKTQQEELESLSKYGFLVNKDQKYCKNLLEVQKFYEAWTEKRKQQDYGIDGLVIKVNERFLWDELGYTAKSPRAGIAYKFPAETAATKLLSITCQVGRTGAITPVAELKPVLLAGSTVKRATLHNADEIERLDVRVGDTISVRKAGDVIPEIFNVFKELRPKDAQKFIMPTKCPSCKTTLTRTQVGKELSVAFYCLNKDCPAKHLENLIHFVSKKGMNIEGLGEKIVETFAEIGLITDIVSIYSLKKEDIVGLEGFGEKSAENIIISINNSRTVPLHRLLYSLGIRHIGEQTAKDIAKHFLSFESIMTATKEQLSLVEGVGEKVADALMEYFSYERNRVLMNGLLKELTVIVEQRKNDGTFFNKTFVISGTLPTLSRDEAKKIIEDNGGKVSGSVSKKTSYLLLGEGGGSKKTDAMTLNIPVLSEEEFRALL